MLAPRMWARGRLVGWLLSLAVALPAPARAYLIDANDARVVDHGTFEAEAQPIGYYQLVLGGEDHTLVAPSMQLYLGIAEGWDLLWLTRGFGVMEPAPGQSAYSIAEQMLAFRAMLRHGAYSDDDAEGPSVTLQFGVLLPGIEADPGVGANVALLVSQQWDAGSLHFNAWANYTRERTLELFFTTYFEGPYEWRVRPTAELWIDLVVDGEPMVSGLIGAVIDVDPDDFLIEAGVRVGGWEGWADLEVRLSAWWCWRLWEPDGAAGEEEGERSEARAGPRRRIGASAF